MASHGIPRVSDSEPRTEQASKKELQKIEEYKILVQQVNDKMQSFDTVELLQLTSKLLTLNPEYYTIWNHRRVILKARMNTETATELISNDLQFLVPLLRKFPKCYWIWKYRLWLLEQSAEVLPPSVTQKFWRSELFLVGKMLSLDSRNFHGWGYRRIVTTALERFENQSLAEEEFQYTTKMIETNLSNFSAWHSRSKLIPRLLDERKADHAERKSFLDDELRLIQEALWTDAYDQSLWFYHQYLVGNFEPSADQSSIIPTLTHNERLTYITKEIDKVVEMLEGAEDCKWIYQSLIHLCNMHRSSSGHWPQPAEDIRSWLSELRVLDPLRRGRWDDLGKGIEEGM